MKKKILIFTIFLSILLIPGLVLSANSEVVLRISNAGPANPSDKTYVANSIFETLVERGTDGRIEVECYHASELGNERETFEGMQMGTIEMGTLTTGALPGFFKPIMVLDIPYLFKSNAVAWEVMGGEFGEKISKELCEKTGFRALAWADQGFRNLTNSVRPIEAPADVKGLKIRTLENPAHMKAMRSLGADPVPMAFNEVYTGLEQGTVDGMDQLVSLVYNMCFYEVQDYLTVSKHVYNFLTLYIADDVFQSLSKADQEIILDAAEVWERVHSGYSQAQIQQGYAKLEEQGMKINFFSLEQMEEFKEINQDVVISFLKDEVGEEWVNEIFVAVEKAEDNIFNN